jgi:hypothetical protein
MDPYLIIIGQFKVKGVLGLQGLMQFRTTSKAMAAYLFLFYKGEFKKVISKYKTPHLYRRYRHIKE